MIHFIFDVDNTITPARQPMTKDFSKFFSSWIIGRRVHLISGSDIAKINEQVPENILMDVKSVHSCSGNQIWTSSYENRDIMIPTLKCVKEEKWWPGNDLLDEISDIIDSSPYPLKFGNHLETRVGSLNLSTLGRNANKDQRDRYEMWDSGYGERKEIIKQLLKNFSHIDCAIGGQISIDIYPKGKDKSQILEWIVGQNDFLSCMDEPVIFFGDKCLNGNDKSLAYSIVKNQLGSFHNVKDYTETLTILKEFYDNN